MRYFLCIILFLVGSGFSAQSQSVRSTRADSIRAANKARTDSIRAVSNARRDSIQKARALKEELKRKKEKAAKKGNRATENFAQTDFSPADSMRQARKDSIRQAREAAAEKKRIALENQRNLILATRKKVIEPLTQEMNGGIRLNSDGWSFFVNRGFIREGGNRVDYLSVDFSEKKHPKETRTSNDNFAVTYPNEIKPIPYKYGKVNNFYQFKIGYGTMRKLTGKLDRKNVTIHWIANGGLSIGLLKPYYLDMLVPEGNVYVRKYQKYSEANKTYFLDLNNAGTILGGSSFTRGIGETTIQPGFHLKSGFYFDYCTTRKSFIGVEIGASAELYFRQIEIMKNTSNSAYFFNFYADFRFGKRWE